MRSFKHLRTPALLAATTLLAAGLVGCEDADDPAEAVEDAAEESADAIEDAGEEVEDAVDDAVDDSGG